MTEPTFDREGYPSDETLDAIQHWQLKDIKKDPEELLEFIRKAWSYPERAQNVRPGIWTFSTGGWSGNESLLDAFYQNINWTFLSWRSIRLSGGFLCVATTEASQHEMENLHQSIVKWGWNKSELGIMITEKG